ncbi:MAG: SDR family oxidoreductase [Clostridiales bacterium]|nr:SDR family oxidoreductase [Clostridiales bacterium]
MYLNSKKVVLVAGASTGIGLSVAKKLAADGYIVYAGARSYKEPEVETGYTRLTRLHLDVTDQASVDSVIAAIMSREGKLDVLVNCAVYLVRGSVEDTSIDEFSGVINTALIGTLRMCKAAVPIMRMQKSGTIINFSSMNGLMAIPFVSSYTAAKFAIEGLSETLSMEVKDFGIRVVLIEPGDHRNGSGATRINAKNAELESSVYSGKFKQTIGRVIKDEAEGSDPDRLAGMIGQIIENPKPKLRYKRIASFEHLAVWMRSVLPGRVFEKFISEYYYDDTIVKIPRRILDNPLEIFKAGSVRE